jgi:hypothetical protein
MNVFTLQKAGHTRQECWQWERLLLAGKKFAAVKIAPCHILIGVKA